ncbi:hypothetical protein CGRA01v4_02353 [Colletotrichum graminicola]|nr:hypothetical protein CGRA01v4_02353 [Colletotrichum graminicola]
MRGTHAASQLGGSTLTMYTHAVHAFSHAKVYGLPTVFPRNMGREPSLPPVLPAYPHPVLSSPTSLSRMILNPTEWMTLLDRQRQAKEEHQCALGFFGGRAALARFVRASREGFVHAMMSPPRSRITGMQAALSCHHQPRRQFLLRRRILPSCSASPYDCDFAAG